MIDVEEKGSGLFLHLEAHGIRLVERDNVWTLRKPEQLERARRLIDDYDPSGDEIVKAKEKLRAASLAVRSRYVTDRPGKESEYRDKLAEATAFLASGAKGEYLSKVSERTGQDMRALARTWVSRARETKRALVEIAAAEERAAQQIEDAGDWLQIATLADAAVSELEKI